MKLTDYDVYISKDYATAIVNNDYSGLNNDDEKLISDYMRANNYYDVVILDPDDETNIIKCDISGYINNCYQVKFYID